MHRAALEATDRRRPAKKRFAEGLADMLCRRAHAGRIRRPAPLAASAAPAVPGALRGRLHRAVEGVVVAEIDKTLTNHPLDEVKRIVAETLAA